MSMVRKLHSHTQQTSLRHREEKCRRLLIRYKNYQQVYTGGSKEDSKFGCAVKSGNHINMQRIPDDS